MHRLENIPNKQAFFLVGVGRVAIQSFKLENAVVTANTFKIKSSLFSICLYEPQYLIDCPLYNKIRGNFFTLFNKDLNETPIDTINRLLNPNTTQEL